MHQRHAPRWEGESRVFKRYKLLGPGHQSDGFLGETRPSTYIISSLIGGGSWTFNGQQTQWSRKWDCEMRTMGNI